MRAAITKKPTPADQPVAIRTDKSRIELMAKVKMSACANAAIVAEAFPVGFDGRAGDDMIAEVASELKASMKLVEDGDLSGLEQMLVGQANALQTMFVSLARRAQAQEYQRHLETFLGLALKCQAQSRATIDSLVNLKYPRTTVIAKQANINQRGQQQVNNDARAGEPSSATPKTKLLEESHGGEYLDSGTAPAPARSDPQMEAVGAIHRPEDAGGQGRSSAQRLHRRPLEGGAGLEERGQRAAAPTN